MESRRFSDPCPCGLCSHEPSGIASLASPIPPVFPARIVFALLLHATSDLRVVPIMDNGAQGQTKLRDAQALGE